MTPGDVAQWTVAILALVAMFGGLLATVWRASVWIQQIKDSIREGDIRVAERVCSDIKEQITRVLAERESLLKANEDAHREMMTAIQSNLKMLQDCHVRITRVEKIVKQIEDKDKR